MFLIVEVFFGLFLFGGLVILGFFVDVLVFVGVFVVFLVGKVIVLRFFGSCVIGIFWFVILLFVCEFGGFKLDFNFLSILIDFIIKVIIYRYFFFKKLVC